MPFALTIAIGSKTLFSPREAIIFSFVSSSLLLELSRIWLLTDNEVWCLRLHLKQVRLEKSTARWPYLRQLKHNYSELTIFPHFTGSFTSARSFSLCPVPSQNTHFQLVAFYRSALKFLSLWVGTFSFLLSVTGFLSTQYFNASVSLESLIVATQHQVWLYPIEFVVV